MTERRRPPRRGRGQRPPRGTAAEPGADPNPYRDDAEEGTGGRTRSETEVETTEPPPDRSAVVETPERTERPPRPERQSRSERNEKRERQAPAAAAENGAEQSPRPEERREVDGAPPAAPPAEFAPPAPPVALPPIPRAFSPETPPAPQAPPTFPTSQPFSPQQPQQPRGDRPPSDGGYPQERRNGRRHRRGRGRGGGGGGGGGGGQRREHQPQIQQIIPVVATAETRGWFDPARDGGFIRRPANSYLAEPGDAYVPPAIVRQYSIRRADLVDASIGYDQRGRPTVVEIKAINDAEPESAARRPEFNSLPASYPERKLFMETGRPAKAGAELIRRAIDLIAPIGYGQRALIVAPARAGKTTLLHAITEGVAVNHPNAVLLILLVDERPEEVSEAISWGVGEVISSSFDQPAQRHVDVTEIVLERARRLLEGGKDVVIVLDSLTRMARAHNTAERGTGRTLSGGLDSTAMAKPKAFFGSARAIPQSSGGGSLTIIATALIETGSRMDDVIFEEFKGTGNSEIKLDRGLAEKRIYPAIDIATSGTRREEKLFRPDQIDSVYTLRRGLSQMPPQSAMEWLIKRIAATPSNDALLAGL